MTPIADIEQRLDDIVIDKGDATSADELLRAGEEILEHWITGKGAEPTSELREGFRLLALHRQGAIDDASFNACRETCRELVYHYNLMNDSQPDKEQVQSSLAMMALVANHLVLFVSGKMQEAGLGDFCCSSKPFHNDVNYVTEVIDA